MAPPIGLTKVTSGVRTLGTDEVTADIIKDDVVTNAKIKSDAAIAQSKLAEVTAGDLASTLDLSSKTVTLAAGAVTPHVPEYDDNALKEDIALLGFRAASTGSLAKYNLVDQTIDAFEDASGIDASASTNEVRNASNYYSGSETETVTATGGTITTDGDYTVHKFLIANTGTDFTTDTAQDVEYLVIGGGGGGGYYTGGGGGAGGYRTGTLSVTPDDYTVTVGAAGAGGAPGAGSDGGDSVFSSITSDGGGGGGGGSGAGRDGGSGGGASFWADGGSSTAGQGYDGGDGIDSSAWGARGAGGGGSSEAGEDGGISSGGDGGNGTSSSITGSAVTRAGGGGAGEYYNSGSAVAGSGGSGGGGDGGRYRNGTAGTADTGSGGGGGG